MSPPPLPGRAAATAVAMLCGAGVLFGLMAFVAKLAAARLPGAEVAFVRFAVGSVGVALAGATVVRLRPINLRSLALRGLFGGAAVLLFFTSIAHLPVAIFLGERVARVTVVALVLTMLGVVLVVEGTAPPDRFAFGPWELCGLCSALLSGAAVTAVRAARRTDGPWEIFGAFCLFGLLTTAPFSLPRWVAPTAFEWLLVGGVGLVSLVAQVLFTAALRHVRAATSGAISQITPITALLLGVWFNHDRLGGLAAAGSALTVGGVALAAGWARRSPAEAEPPPVSA